MNKTYRLALGLSAAILVAATAVAGCGSDDKSSGGSTTAAKTLKPAKVAYVTYRYEDYQQAAEAGLKVGVKPSGGSVTVFNAAFDPQKQQKQCEDAVTSGRYNVIALAAVSPPTGVPCVKAAKAAGIPVIALELTVGKSASVVEPQVDGVVGSVVLPQAPTGIYETEMVKKACAGKDPCNVVMDSVPGDTYGTILTAAVKAVPGVKIINKINTNFDPSQMAKTAPDMFASNPNIDVLVTLADGQAIAAIPAAKAAGLFGKVKLLATGGSRQGAAAIADGSIFGTLASWPFQMGVAAGKMAVQAANGQTLEPNAVNGLTIDKPAVVTKDTVAQFKPEWGAPAP
jgi:ribose transport system substrate-binding protein